MPPPPRHIQAQAPAVPAKRPVASNFLGSGNNSKAGLPQDRLSIDTIILANTNPRFSAFQSRKAAYINERGQHRKAKLRGMSDKEKEKIARQVDDRVQAMQAKWVSYLYHSKERFHVHMDMDAFFASVEERDTPALASLPMAVGDAGGVSTANYVARRFGVVSAMPGYIALKLCPQLVIIPCHFAKYRAASQQVEQVLREAYGEGNELDDLSMYMDEIRFRVPIAGAEAAVAKVRALIKARTGLTCSAGIAPTPSLAKLCSNARKPGRGHLCSPGASSGHEQGKGGVCKLPRRF